MRRSILLRKLASQALLSICLATSSVAAQFDTAPPPWTGMAQNNRSHVVLAWNDLGMHCYNRDYRDLCVLPPFNTLWAQVVKIGDPPQFVTTDISVEYRIIDNTYSVGKTNFWSYAQDIFNLSAPLPPNIGLAGKGLRGKMDLVADSPWGAHFEAVGIPLTEFPDSKTKTANPFQLAEITVKDRSGAILAQTIAVAPVSSELNCETCHADSGDATLSTGITPTGGVFTNILSLHDLRNPAISPPLMNSRPVLCAQPSCHSDNALGANGPGYAGTSSLSHAMHNHHKNLMDITPDTTEGCYSCHPGASTQCLRDTMSQSFAVNCTTCHGNMPDVAAADREPWVVEPRCDNVKCHGAGYALDQALYRHSRGHGGVYCAACHDSPHATAPSREFNDSLKFLILQDRPDTLRKCTACHTTVPTSGFSHRWPAP